MKKVSVILLFVLPILVFTVVSVSGIVVDDIKRVDVESVEIVHEDIIVSSSGQKNLIVNECGQLRLGYKLLPDDSSDKRVVWEIVEGSEFAEINSFGVVTVTKLGGNVTVRLWDFNRKNSDVLYIRARSV